MTLQFELDYDQKLPPSAQAGMQQADENADQRWKHIWDACVLAVAKRQELIVSDDVLAEFESLKLQPSTHTLAAIGPAMQRACRMKILRGTNETKRSQRPEKHANRQNVYISNYFKKEGA